MKEKLEKNKNIEEICLDSISNSFSYTGTVKVSIGIKDKKFVTYEFKNNGRWPLFYFLNLCLMGQYNAADNQRPRLIQAFDFNSDGLNCPTILDDAAIGSGHCIGDWFNSTTLVSLTPWPYEILPDISLEENEIGSSSLTYKFTVPFTQLNIVNGIEGFALYSRKDQAVNNPTAFFFLTDENGKIKDLLKRDNISSTYEIGTEYNLYVEWNLRISNK